MQVLTVLRVPRASLEFIRDLVLVNVEPESARLVLNAQPDHAHLYPAGDEILILDRMEYRRELGSKARRLYLCRVSERSRRVPVGIREIDLKLQILPRTVHLEVVHCDAWPLWIRLGWVGVPPEDSIHLDILGNANHMGGGLTRRIRSSDKRP